MNPAMGWMLGGFNDSDSPVLAPIWPHSRLTHLNDFLTRHNVQALVVDTLDGVGLPSSLGTVPSYGDLAIKTPLGMPYPQGPYGKSNFYWFLRNFLSRHEYSMENVDPNSGFRFFDLLEVGAHTWQASACVRSHAISQMWSRPTGRTSSLGPALPCAGRPHWHGRGDSGLVPPESRNEGAPHDVVDQVLLLRGSAADGGATGVRYWALQTGPTTTRRVPVGPQEAPVMTLPRDSRRTSYHAEIRLPRRLVAAWAFTTAAPALLANTLAPAFGVGLMGALSPHSGPMGRVSHPAVGHVRERRSRGSCGLGTKPGLGDDPA